MDAVRASGSAHATPGRDAARSQDFLYRPNDRPPMIAVDTSALMAIVLGDPDAGPSIRILETETEILISAGTVAESLIVATRRNAAGEMAKLIDGLGFDAVTVTPAAVRRIADAYERWGKVIRPASLNFADCFSCEVAREHSCRLLFVGNDFTRTDPGSAL